MPFKPEYESYSVFVRVFPGETPTFPGIDENGADYTHLEDDASFGMILAQLAIQAGIMSDPLVKKRGIHGTIGITGNDGEQSFSALDVHWPGTPSYATNPIAKAFFEVIQEYKTKASA